jgi:hypothetical protein
MKVFSLLFFIYIIMFVLQDYHSKHLLRRSITKSHDGVISFYLPDIHICFERIVLFLRSMFKFLGHIHFVEEVYATSKEIVLFHDNGFVLLRFACGFN